MKKFGKILVIHPDRPRVCGHLRLPVQTVQAAGNPLRGTHRRGGRHRESTVVTGKIQPRDEVNVKPQISGIIAELYKEAGQTVKEGEIIAKLKVIPGHGPALQRPEPRAPERSEPEAGQDQFRPRKGPLRQAARERRRVRQGRPGPPAGGGGARHRQGNPGDCAGRRVLLQQEREHHPHPLHHLGPHPGRAGEGGQLRHQLQHLQRRYDHRHGGQHGRPHLRRQHRRD